MLFSYDNISNLNVDWEYRTLHGLCVGNGAIHSGNRENDSGPTSHLLVYTEGETAHFQECFCNTRNYHLPTILQPLYVLTADHCDSMEEFPGKPIDLKVC